MSSQGDRLNEALAGRYRIERELGAGGMATVYLAHDERHDRQVAIKVLHPELAAALGGERFLAEIKTTAKLQHPHILPLLDSGDAGGLLYYVMPYATGETLRDRLARERQLPIADAIATAREVADALGAAHGVGIIHRDIKPENILLQGGHALVADFGIALAVQSAGGARMTQTGLSLGTPQYMSPEQAMGERVIDARSDIYALAAVTYEMLVGEPPFTGPSVQAIVARVMTEEPRGIGTQRKAVPPALEAAVLRALEKLPADRFATAMEFAAALDDPRGQTRAATSRHAAPGARGRAVAIVVGTAMLAAVGGWLAGRREAASDVAVSASVLLADSTPLEPAHFNSEGMATFDLSRDGSTLVFVGRKGKTTQLYLRRMATFDTRALDGTDGAFLPFFSPTGDAVAFFSDTRLLRISLADGHVTQVARGIYEPFGGAWMPDGRFVLSTARAFALDVVSATGDSLARVPCGGYCSLPEALPDGRRVVTSSSTGLGVLDIEARTVRPLRRWQGKSDDEEVRGSMARYDGDGHLVWVTYSGDVVAAPFDAGRAEITGPSTILAQGAQVETGRGAAQFALGGNGAIAFAPGPLRSVGLLVISDRNGRLDTLRTPAANFTRVELSPDGQRVLTHVRSTDGVMTIGVVDVATGQFTPWQSSAKRLSDSQWDPDSRRAWYRIGTTLYHGDPSVTTAPDSFSLPNVDGFQVLPDGKRLLTYAGDTLRVGKAGEVGAPVSVGARNMAYGAVTDDAKWVVGQEAPTGRAAMVARALDGSGQRFVVSNNVDFSMVATTPGANEVIVGVNGHTFSEATVKAAALQTFWSFPYHPGASPPFGEPRKLFSADVADFPGRNYSVAMQGKRFAFKQHIAGPPLREIRVVRNWHALLSAAPSASKR